MSSPNTTNVFAKYIYEILLQMGTNLGLIDTDGKGQPVAGRYQPFKLVSANGVNATVVKNSPGAVGMIAATNINSSPRYLKIYDKASAPVVGTDVPVWTFLIPGRSTGAGTNIPLPTSGIEFEEGIAMALTTEATDAGTTGVTINENIVNMAFK